MTLATSVEVSPDKFRPVHVTATQDLLGGLQRTELWGRLGWLDVKRRYRRTIIGPFWTSVTLTIYVLSVGTVGVALWKQNIYDYLPFLASGMIMWTMVSSIIVESCTLLVSGQSLFRNVRFEYSILAYALVWRNFIIFLHNLAVYFLIVLFLKPSSISFATLLVFPGMLLILLNGAWVALLCGLICLRFRDVQPLVASIVQISMLITPLFWPPETLVGARRSVFVDLNPLYHALDVVRAPLLGNVPSMITYGVMLAMAIGGWWLTYAMFSRFRKRIAYWS